MNVDVDSKLFAIDTVTDSSSLLQERDEISNLLVKQTKKFFCLGAKNQEKALAEQFLHT